MSYESQMVGQKPSKSAPHNNYESDMKGEKGKKMAAGGVAKMRHGEADSKGMPIMKKKRAGK